MESVELCQMLSFTVLQMFKRGVAGFSMQATISTGCKLYTLSDAKSIPTARLTVRLRLAACLMCYDTASFAPWLAALQCCAHTKSMSVQSKSYCIKDMNTLQTTVEPVSYSVYTSCPCSAVLQALPSKVSSSLFLRCHQLYFAGILLMAA